MSTGASFGFIKDGKIKKTFWHDDGYVEGLGVLIKNQISKYSIKHMKSQFDKIIPVDLDSRPSDKIIDTLVARNYINLQNAKNIITTQYHESFNKYDWGHLLAEWDNKRNIQPYMDYDVSFMIQVDEETEDDEVIWEYDIDLDKNNLVVISCAETHIPLEEIKYISDDVFIDTIYANETKAMKDFEV